MILDFPCILLITRDDHNSNRTEHTQPKENYPHLYAPDVPNQMFPGNILTYTSGTTMIWGRERENRGT